MNALRAWCLHLEIWLAKRRLQRACARFSKASGALSAACDGYEAVKTKLTTTEL